MLLASTKAAGTGLNLTCACRVLILDVWWTWAHEDQVMLRLQCILSGDVPGMDPQSSVTSLVFMPHSRQSLTSLSGMLSLCRASWCT